MASGKEPCPDSRSIPANRYLIFLLIAWLGVLVDLATKSWIFGRLWPPTRPDVPRVIWLWEGHIGLEVSLNEGALFGIGQGQVWLFVTLSVAAAAGILYWLFVAGEARSLWLTVALGAITGGIIGNFYDRVGLPGLTWPAGHPIHAEGSPVYAVRDWILWQWSDELRWPNFNVADSLLVCGAIMLVLHAFLPSIQAGEQPAAGAVKS
jgi:signal peptidase II